MSETDLILGCKNAEHRAQEMLYNRFNDMLFRVSFRYLRNEIDAEDVLIVAFGKILSGIGKFAWQGEGSLEAWLRKIVVNESLMWLRKRHNFNLTETLDGSFEEPDLQAFSEMDAEDIYKSIAALPTGYRTVFNLNVIEGYNHNEIGKLLGISENTSRSQLFKAKAILRKVLTRDGFDYGT